METINCVLVGDEQVGKTSLLAMYSFETLLDEYYVPTLLEIYPTDLVYKGRPYRLKIWDTPGKDSYLSTHPYEHTDVFFICFAIDNPTSFKNAETFWCDEVRHLCPGAIYLLVGLKSGLRNDGVTVEKLTKAGKSPVTNAEGITCADKIKAHGYLECSAEKGEGLKAVFECGVLAFFECEKK